MLEKKLDANVSAGYYAVGSFFMWSAVVAGLILFMIPATEWIKTAMWSAWNGWTIVEQVAPNSWLQNPDRALGLHKIVSFFLGFPLWFTIPALLGLTAKGFNDAGDEIAPPLDERDFDGSF